MSRAWLIVVPFAGLLATLGGSPSSVPGEGTSPAARPLRPLEVLFFQRPECSKCQDLRAGFLEELNSKYGDALRIVEFDLGAPAGFVALRREEDRLGVRTTAPVVAIVGDRCMDGIDAVRAGLEEAIEAGMRKRDDVSAGIRWRGHRGPGR